MRKLLNQPWFVAVLAIAAVALVAISLREQFGQPAWTGVADAGDATVEETGDPAANEEGSEAPPPSVVAALAALELPAVVPDPFGHRETMLVADEPVTEGGPVLPDQIDLVRLTGVWRQGSVGLAFINNRIVRAGDVIGRITIDDVSVDGVWVSHWKGRDFVAFGGEFRLATPAGQAAGREAQGVALHEN